MRGHRRGTDARGVASPQARIDRALRRPTGQGARAACPGPSSEGDRVHGGRQAPRGAAFARGLTRSEPMDDRSAEASTRRRRHQGSLQLGRKRGIQRTKLRSDAMSTVPAARHEQIKVPNISVRYCVLLNTKWLICFLFPRVSCRAPRWFCVRSAPCVRENVLVGCWTLGPLEQTDRWRARLDCAGQPRG